jgi:hypothetical protein
MNRPLWLNFLRIWLFIILPPAFLAIYLTGFVGRHFGFGSAAQFLSYAVLYVLLLLCWSAVFVVHSHVSQPPPKNRSKNDRNA